MSRLMIDFDQTACVACGACTVACMDQNDLVPKGARDMFRKISTVEQTGEHGDSFCYLSMACMHCNNAPCVAACPCGCITKDPETGFTVYDNTNCIGCRSCSLACPFSAPTFNEDGKMRKCDGCNTRVKSGLLPACVRVCPFNALSLEDEADCLKKRSENSISQIASAILKSR